MGMATETQFHVLVVHDSLIDRKLIERLLKTSSYQVTIVDSGSKALEFLGFVEDDDQRDPNPNSDPHPHPLSVSPKYQQGKVGFHTPVDAIREIRQKKDNWRG